MGPMSSGCRCLVLEDADNYLHAEAGGREAAVSRLLNTADGLIGNDRLLVLLTMNTPADRLNPALLRPGRMLASIGFERFAQVEARRWLGRPTSPWAGSHSPNCSRRGATSVRSRRPPRSIWVAACDARRPPVQVWWCPTRRGRHAGIGCFPAWPLHDPTTGFPKPRSNRASSPVSGHAGRPCPLNKFLTASGHPGGAIRLVECRACRRCPGAEQGRRRVPPPWRN